MTENDRELGWVRVFGAIVSDSEQPSIPGSDDGIVAGLEVGGMGLFAECSAAG